MGSESVLPCIDFSINHKYLDTINICNCCLVLTFSIPAYYFMNLFSIIFFLHLLGFSNSEIISDLPSTSFNLAKHILGDLRRLPFDYNMQLQPLGVDHSVGQTYYGLPEANKSLTYHMESDPGKGRGSGNKALIPSNKGGSVVPSKSGNSGLAPSNTSNPLVYNPMGVPTLPEPRKPLGLRQLIDKTQASVPVTKPGPSSSTNATVPVTEAQPSTSSGTAASATTGMLGSGQNSAVMIPGSTGELLPGKYEETPAG